MDYMQFAGSPAGQESAEKVVPILDSSISMTDKDWPPSRLEAAFGAAGALIDEKAKRYPNDEVAIVTFSRQAKTVHPLVSVGSGAADLKKSMMSIVVDSYTNITAGLGEAEKVLFGLQRQSVQGMSIFGPGTWLGRLLGVEKQVEHRFRPAGGDTLRRIILLTDGCHNHGKDPIPTASRLKSDGVVIDCIGIGTDKDEFDEACLKSICSRNPDGSLRYCFIGDQMKLIKKFEQLANRIRPA